MIAILLQEFSRSHASDDIFYKFQTVFKSLRTSSSSEALSRLSLVRIPDVLCFISCSPGFLALIGGLMSDTYFVRRLKISRDIELILLLFFS